jgi:hypothetical protein
MIPVAKPSFSEQLDILDAVQSMVGHTKRGRDVETEP